MNTLKLYNLSSVNKFEKISEKAGLCTYLKNTGEKLVVKFKDGKPEFSTRYNSDGSVLFRKDYKYANGDTFVTITSQNDSGEMIITGILERTKSYIAKYSGVDKTLTGYFRKIGTKWKNLTEFISRDKSATNAHGTYLTCGKDLNTLLRSGKPYREELFISQIPPECKDYIEMLKIEARQINRQLIDAIPKLDEMTHSSFTQKPMIVYRDAPTSWLKSAQNGKLIDRGYCSTSTVAGASMEGMLTKEPVTRYTIELPKGTPFYDLRNTTEKEMLLPRNSEFLDLGGGRLKWLGEIKN